MSAICSAFYFFDHRLYDVIKNPFFKICFVSFRFSFWFDFDSSERERKKKKRAVWHAEHCRAIFASTRVDRFTGLWKNNKILFFLLNLFLWCTQDADGVAVEPFHRSGMKNGNKHKSGGGPAGCVWGGGNEPIRCWTPDKKMKREGERERDESKSLALWRSCK